MANITLDDSNPSIIYNPPWNAISTSEPCPRCASTPDLDMMFNQTFHDSTFRQSAPPNQTGLSNIPLIASVSFNGTALYVFCVLPESHVDPVGNTDMSFYIDGELGGSFEWTPPGNAGIYDYNIPVFQNESLTPREHNFTLQNGRANGTQSLVLLDKIIYTAFDLPLTTSSVSLSSSPASSVPTSTPVPSSSGGPATKKSPWIIIGPTVAVTLGVLLLALALWFLFRWRNLHWYSSQRQVKASNATFPSPCTLPTSSESPTGPTLRAQKHRRRFTSELLGSEAQPWSWSNNSMLEATPTSHLAVARIDEVYVDAPPAYDELE